MIVVVVVVTTTTIVVVVGRAATIGVVFVGVVVAAVATTTPTTTIGGFRRAAVVAIAAFPLIPCSHVGRGFEASRTRATEELDHLVKLAALCLVPMSKKKNKPEKSIKLLKDAEQAVTSDYIIGDCLDELLSKLIRSVEVAQDSRGGLPEKIWMKWVAPIRTWEAELVTPGPKDLVWRPYLHEDVAVVLLFAPGFRVKTLAVIIAADCNPKWLTKHIPTLASTRQVPVLCLKDNKGSSLRLGQVVNVGTALAIGIKARDSIINKAIDEILKDYKPVADEQ
ncbi:hypothetical protein D1007_21754 [Hordeum vulgare]|nr:hypothetical protein D1007_21754 [Hordeum vulgare]